MTVSESKEITTRSAEDSGAPLGGRLRTLRQARGLSLGALARLSGVQDSTLSRWESGKRQPRIPELEAVLDALEASGAARRDFLRQITAPRALMRLRTLDAAAAPPVGGDLLQALRLRRGWTQADTARAVGVHQAQIARWEHGDAWPDAEKLHALCWHLGAADDEMRELTRIAGGGGQFLPESQRVGGEPELPVPGAGLSDEAALPWALYVGQYLKTPPQSLLLRLFHLQHRLSALASHHVVAEQLLPNAYAIQARHHLVHREMRQAAAAAQRGLALARRKRVRGGLHTDQSLWFGSVVVLAAVSAENGSAAGLRYAVRVLSEWLPAVKECPAHYAWGRADLASYQARLGNADEAVGLSTAVCQQAADTVPTEYRFRLQDHARVLGQVGRPREALRVLNTSRNTGTSDVSPSHYFDLRQELLEAQFLMLLQDRCGADERLRVAEQIVRRYRSEPTLEDFVKSTLRV